MQKARCIYVKFVRTSKDKGLIDQTIGFPYTPELSLEDNVSAAIGFIEAFHDFNSVLSVVLEF